MGLEGGSLRVLLVEDEPDMASALAAALKRYDGGAFYQFTCGMQCPIPRALLDRLGLQANCMGRVLLNVPPASVYRITRSNSCAMDRS